MTIKKLEIQFKMSFKEESKQSSLLAGPFSSHNSSKIYPKFITVTANEIPMLNLYCKCAYWCNCQCGDKVQLW